MTEYALYSGDEFIAIGTIEEIAERMGVKPDTVRWYTTPTAERRRSRHERKKWEIVRLDEE